jgi:hypothetical protein
MIQELLKSKDGTSRSKEKNLPELTPEETASAITKERMRRAERLYCDIDSINLSDEAIIKVLQNAREHKLSNQKTSEYWKKVDQEKVYHLPDAEELFKQFKANATQIIKREFEIDVFNQALIKDFVSTFQPIP